MFALYVCLVGGLLTQQAPDPLVLTGVVVDQAGKPMSDVDVVLARPNVADGSTPTLARSMTDCARGVSPRIRPPTVERDRASSRHLGLPSQPLGYRAAIGSYRERGTGAAPVNPRRAVQTDSDRARFRRPSPGGRASRSRPHHLVSDTRRLAGTIDGRHGRGRNGDAHVPPGDDRSGLGAGERSRHRPSLSAAPATSRQRSLHAELGPAGAYSRLARL